MTCADSSNAIGSLASADGPTPSRLPESRQADLFGQAHAPANHSAPLARAMALAIPVTYGPPGNASLRSANLQRCLANRLAERLLNRGSTLYKLTWNVWVTPLGVYRFRLQALAHRISGIERIGWATPTARDWKDSPGMTAQREGRGRLDQLPRQAYLCTGETLTGPQEVMASGGHLNPGHSRWLMGYRDVWDACGVTAMQSCRSKRPSSS